MMNSIRQIFIMHKEKIVHIALLFFLSTVLLGYSTLIFNKQETGVRPFVYVAFLCFVIIALAIISCIIKKKIRFMCLILVLMASLFYINLPVGSGPDEANHFYRAFEISCGDLLSKQVGENNMGGNILPIALEKYNNKKAEIDWNQVEEIPFQNTALYAPVAYLPQSIAIKIACLVTDNVYTIFMAGRLGAMIVNLALSCWALFKMPFAKEILFLIMLFPMNMQEMVVMSSDGWTMAIISAFLAYVLNLKYKEKIGRKEAITLFLLGFSIALSKIVYIVICLIVFLIPHEIFNNKKQARMFQYGFVILTLAINLLWLGISYGYMIEFNPGVNSTEQIKYVLQNIPEFYLIVIRTIFTNGAFWIQSMIGSSLGALNIPVNWSVWLIYLIILVYAVFRYRFNEKLKFTDNVICLMIFLSGIALIFASLYVQWTALKNPIIDGIQGRYFTPLLMFLFIPLISFGNVKKNVMMKSNKKCSSNNMNICITFVPVFLNCIALIDIFNFTLQNV